MSEEEGWKGWMRRGKEKGSRQETITEGEKEIPGINKRRATGAEEEAREVLVLVLGRQARQAVTLWRQPTRLG